MKSTRQTFEFRPHGSSEFRVSGAIIRIGLEGPFNLEGIQEMWQRLIALLAEVPAGQAVVTITEVRNSLLAPEEAWAHAAAQLGKVQAGSTHILGTAWVVAADVEGRSLLLPKAHSMFAAAGRRFEVFEDAEQARRWAEALLAEA